MVVSILSLISGFFGLAGKVFEWLYARNLVNAGKVQQKLDDLAVQVNDAQIAVAAREAVRAAVAAAPERVPDDDPFLRD